MLDFESRRRGFDSLMAHQLVMQLIVAWLFIYPLYFSYQFINNFDIVNKVLYNYLTDFYYFIIRG